MVRTMNSAGLSGAKPTTTLTRPASISLCGLTVLSQVTKKLSDSAPDADCWKSALTEQPAHEPADRPA